MRFGTPSRRLSDQLEAHAALMEANTRALGRLSAVLGALLGTMSHPAGRNGYTDAESRDHAT